MISRAQLAKQALSSSLRVRSAAGFQPWEPICVYDLAQALGIEVFFVDIPSLEGVYWRQSKPTILLPAERPAGRQHFNCAHELGHHTFDHGSKIDEVPENPALARYKDSEEFLADCFAGFLLMPKTAVVKGFSVRGLNPCVPTPVDILTVAGWLGVGYSTLVQQMRWSLKLITATRATELLKVSPKAIKRQIIGREVSENLIVVDKHWVGRPIDIQVGDLILVSPDVVNEATAIVPAGDAGNGKLFVGNTPGISRLFSSNSEWSAYVRVSRRNYVGRGMYRHLEEADEDE